MKSWLCVNCKGEMPLRARPDAKFCSGRCRVASHRKRGVPQELRRRPRWVRWSDRKVPLTATGRAASSTNPETWSRHSDAARSTAGVGVGFVLNGDGIICIDLDGCIDAAGSVTPAAMELVRLAGATYVEVSPSGRGLHIWGRADLTRGRLTSFKGQPVEIFGGSPSKLGDVSEAVSAALT
jgi:primase-polymerase (primpol)-like protein